MKPKKRIRVEKFFDSSVSEIANSGENFRYALLKATMVMKEGDVVWNKNQYKLRRKLMHAIEKCAEKSETSRRRKARLNQAKYLRQKKQRDSSSD